MSNKISSSLIVSTYNWPEALDLVLLSILNQTVFPIEVIIADDGSTNKTKELIEKYQKIFSVKLMHVWHEDDGFRKTIILNEAYRIAQGDYIIQIDGDIILNKYFIEDHLKNAKPGYFIKGSRGRLTETRSKLLLENRNINLNAFTSGMQSRINATRLPFLRCLFYGKKVMSRKLKGCNFAVWKRDFVNVNGYNNDLTGWGHEDIELAARLNNNGVYTRQLKLTAVCFHIYHKINSRASESNNLAVYQKTIEEKIATCSNGFIRR